MSKRKWVRTEAEYADDGIMVAIEPHGVISLRLARRRRCYSIPVSTLYEALRARDVLGLSGTTVPVVMLEPGKVYKEIATDRPVYPYRLSDVEHGCRPVGQGTRWSWWILAPTPGQPCLGRGIVDSRDAACDAITVRLAWLELHARFIDDRPARDEDDPDDDDLDASKT